MQPAVAAIALAMFQQLGNVISDGTAQHPGAGCRSQRASRPARMAEHAFDGSRRAPALHGACLDNKRHSASAIYTPGSDS